MGKDDQEKSSVAVFTEGMVELPLGIITPDFIEGISAKILRHLELYRVNLNIIITDNAFIREINKRYRGKDSPTDVISFAYREESFPEIDNLDEELGDIYLSIEKAGEQSADFDNDLQGEVTRLLIHGILHLAGYDHEKGEDEAEKMRSLEEEIINQL